MSKTFQRTQRIQRLLNLKSLIEYLKTHGLLNQVRIQIGVMGLRFASHFRKLNLLLAEQPKVIELTSFKNT